MGVLVDIVPNHVGVATPAAEPRGGGTLLQRRAAVRATPQAFDVDWDVGGGRIRIPVLGDGLRRSTRCDIEDGELRYHDHRFPLAAGTYRSDSATIPARSTPGSTTS